MPYSGSAHVSDPHEIHTYIPITLFLSPLPKSHAYITHILILRQNTFYPTHTFLTQ